MWVYMLSYSVPSGTQPAVELCPQFWLQTARLYHTSTGLTQVILHHSFAKLWTQIASLSRFCSPGLQNATHWLPTSLTLTALDLLKLSWKKTASVCHRSWFLQVLLLFLLHCPSLCFPCALRWSFSTPHLGGVLMQSLLLFSICSSVIWNL